MSDWISVNDRELLEFAAKAAGITILRWGKTDGAFINGGESWSPLTEDGAAFRLAHKLGIQIKWFGSIETIRRAIVSSAADTGRMMTP